MRGIIPSLGNENINSAASVDLLLSRHLKGQHPSPVAGRPNESTNYARCKLQIGDFEVGHDRTCSFGVLNVHWKFVEQGGSKHLQYHSADRGMAELCSVT